ncbi:MAG: sigma-70 family RNA polymerase sigma factor [Clostridiales bacterium]|nr:sigma-70 family RNA polymerase sigma factor [Clostridiales bacterium]
MINENEFVQRTVVLKEQQYRIAWAMLKNAADCSDAMQEAALKAWTKRHTLREDAYFSTWLIRILINECKTILRKRKRYLLLPQVQEESVPPAATELQGEIDALPDKLRVPLVLYYFEGYAIKEVATLLSLHAGTVKNRLHQARKLLRLELSQEKEERQYER